MNRRSAIVLASAAALGSVVLAVVVASLVLPAEGPPPPAIPAAPSPVAAPPATAAPAAETAEPPVAPPPPAGEVDTEQPVFRDWIAFGSGCRARSDEPGDVTMERATVESGGRVVHRARFHLDQYRLTSADPPPGDPLDFARECAIRIQLGPPPGMRIARVTARTGLVSSKSEGVKLTLLAELKIGVALLGRKLTVHEAGVAHDGWKQVLRLVPGTKPDERLPELACAEGKLVGFDSTWIAERTAPTDEVSVELSGTHVLDIDAELAGCSGG